MSVRLVVGRAGCSVLLLVVVAGLSSCASAPEPVEDIALSQDAVNRAVSAGATEYAPLEMKIAQDKLFMMERAIGEKNYELAKNLAEQIEVDGALAERKARTVKSQKELDAAQQGIRILKQEMLQAPDSNLPQR